MARNKSLWAIALSIILLASATDSAIAAESAADSLNKLAVKGRAAKVKNMRAQFGPAWKDVDRNGCDTRNDILKRDLTEIVYRIGTRNCVVESGLLLDPYSRSEEHTSELQSH